MKNQKGVTLIILTVTIAVILILVGATIGTLTDDRGITEQAKDLEERTKEKQKKNDQKLAELIDTLDSIMAEKNTPIARVEQDGSETWNNGTATIKLKVIANGVEVQDYQIEYIKDFYNGGWITYTGPITNLEHGSTITCRLVRDGKVFDNGGITNINILDYEEPKVTFAFDINSTNDEISAVTVKQEDYETGINIGECKWELNNTGEAGQTHFSNTFETSTQKISLSNIDRTKTWYLHVLSVDNAGNHIETIKGPLKIEILTRTIQDAKGNQIVIPGGFELAADSGETVEQGIVIEDDKGNQFVWIPVSNIDGSNNNPIIRDDGSKVIITLGRYTFDGEYNYSTNKTEGTGNPVLIQSASEYQSETEITIDSIKYKELKDYRESEAEKDALNINTSAHNIAEFIEKTQENKGYYIARYEASYGDGYNEFGNSTFQQFKNAKPLSQKSTAFSMDAMNYEKGTLWNYINQPAAAKVSQNMYKNSESVNSDLMNSYAWDTALAYIQSMKNNGYANQNEVNDSIQNTGASSDEVCKIFDMAGNIMEWTTEYCVTDDYNFAPCTARGGLALESNFCSKYRLKFEKDEKMKICGFRTIIYIK